MEMVVNRINTKVLLCYAHHLVISCPVVICAGKRPWVIAECDSHLGGAKLIIISLFSILVSWPDCYGVDARGITISSAWVIVLPSIASCPDEDGAQAITTLQFAWCRVFTLLGFSSLTLSLSLSPLSLPLSLSPSLPLSISLPLSLKGASWWLDYKHTLLSLGSFQLFLHEHGNGWNKATNPMPHHYSNTTTCYMYMYFKNICAREATHGWRGVKVSTHIQKV